MKSKSNGLNMNEALDKANNIDEADSSNTGTGELKQYEIVGVRFKKTSKVYYFDPKGLKINQDAHVIVETARGLEYGCVVIPNKTVDESELVLPLKTVIRIANDKDEAHYEENFKKEAEAFDICLEKIAKHGLEMKLIGAEYTFDNTKLLFYFTADGRIDFRELVKDLASVFRTRIELRQIGIRDEAKMMGGLGVCGRAYCCHSYMNDFVQVSIKMAKEQNLSLNSAKISGACGRLMCCLRYEYDTYLREINKMPKVDAIVVTPDGDGIVVETNPLAGYLKVRLKSDADTAPLKTYPAESIKKVKGYIKSERKDEIDEELKALEKE